MTDTLEQLLKTRRSDQQLMRGVPASDPIAELFQVLQMQSVFYTQAELTAPWGMVIPAIASSLMFHFVVEGECLVEVEGEHLQIQRGDFLMVPHGNGHQLMGSPESECLPLFDLPIETVSGFYERLVYGGSGEPTRLLCGAVSFDHPIAAKLLEMMPPSLLISATDHDESGFLVNTIEMLASESTATRLGSEAVITRLADLLVIQSMRVWIDRQGAGQHGWLAALQDPALGKALMAVHREPGARWNLQGMAVVAGLSRTIFVERFRHCVGQTPMDYLSEWRMALAKNRLQQSNDSVLQIALDFGYQSEAAFGRAYKRITGTTPGSCRPKAQSHDD